MLDAHSDDLQSRLLRHVRAEYEGFRRAALTRDMSPEFVAEMDSLRQQLEGAVEALREIDRIASRPTDTVEDHYARSVTIASKAKAALRVAGGGKAVDNSITKDGA